VRRVAMLLRRAQATVPVLRVTTMVAAAALKRAVIATVAATRNFRIGCIAAANCIHAIAGAIVVL
jgi:hypothetical protein